MPTHPCHQKEPSLPRARVPAGPRIGGLPAPARDGLFPRSHPRHSERVEPHPRATKGLCKESGGRGQRVSWGRAASEMISRVLNKRPGCGRKGEHGATHQLGGFHPAPRSQRRWRDQSVPEIPWKRRQGSRRRGTLPGEFCRALIWPSRCRFFRSFTCGLLIPDAPDALTHDSAVRLIEKWMRFRIQKNTVSALRDALEIKWRYGTSFWVAPILAAAQCGRFDEVLSEDLNHGQQYGSVTGVNSFLEK